MQNPVAKHVTSFNRSPTWITPEYAAEFAAEGRDSKFSKEQMTAWEKNPKEFLDYRKRVEGTMNNFFDMQFKDSEEQKQAFQSNRNQMGKRLKNREDLIHKLVPTFAVGCRRYYPPPSFTKFN
jgi:hypothetical protein